MRRVWGDLRNVKTHLCCCLRLVLPYTLVGEIDLSQSTWSEFMHHIKENKTPKFIDSVLLLVWARFHLLAFEWSLYSSLDYKSSFEQSLVGGVKTSNVLVDEGGAIQPKCRYSRYFLALNVGSHRRTSGHLDLWFAQSACHDNRFLKKEICTRACF